MFSPFIGRHLLILALVAGNFWLAVWLLRRVSGIIQRAFSAAFAGAALMTLLMTMALFADMELTDRAKVCWAVNRRWPKVQVGMTKADLVKLIGEPSEVNFGDQFLYRLHPLSYMHGGVGLKIPAGGTIEQATVEDKNPDDGVAWIPADFGFYFRDQYYSLVQGLATLGLIALAIASLIPRRSPGWGALPFYYPILALVFAFAYELVDRGGWRFDLFFLYILYAIIAITWAIRVTLNWRRS